MSKPTLGYWHIRGFGQPIRFLLAYLGVDYEDKLYSSLADWSADKFNLGLDFPNVPYWVEGDIRLTESKAILRYLAKEKGGSKNAFPTDPVAVRQSDMLENVVVDAWTLLARVAYINSEGEIEHFKSQAPLKYEALSKFLGKKAFLLGEQLTYVDCFFYELLHFYTCYDAEYLDPYPNLSEYKKRFEAVPEIAAYMDTPHFSSLKGCTSPDAKVPIGF